MTLYLSKFFSMKTSFIKNCGDFEGKVCIGYIPWQKKLVTLHNKLPRKILIRGWQIVAVLKNL